MVIERLFPGLMARYYAKRAALVEAQRLYKAAQTTKQRPRRGDSKSANAVMEHARNRVRNWGRYLEENSDLAVGVLDDLVDRVIGRGITVEPMPKRPNGEVDSDLAETMSRAFTDWGRKPENSQVIPWGELQRLLFRAQMRDGEILTKHIQAARGYRFPGPIPYAVEPLEADYLPFDLLQRDRPEIIHGIERDEFGTIVAYHLYRQHPGDFGIPLQPASILQETTRFTDDQIIHLRFVRRPQQLRGISVFHACMHRLTDLDEYEESERLAARVAASFTAAITKTPDMPGVATQRNEQGERTLQMKAGMIFDDLNPGESIETINSNRPSNLLSEFRASQLRAVSAGTGARYSTIARTWDSSYTAMRQETVQTMPGTDRLQDYFIARWVRPVYERCMAMAFAANVFDTRRADPMRLLDADFRGPGVPWVDPKDEVEADVTSISHGLKSRQQVIRERGGDFRRIDAEIETDDFEQPSQQVSQNAEVVEE